MRTDTKRKDSRVDSCGAYVALLRGINVSGKNMVPMKDLVPMFTDAGCRDAQAYIQSGNVVFRAQPKLAPRLPALIAKAIASRFGFSVPMMLRTVDELRRVVEGNPYPLAGTGAGALHVAFLADVPTASQVAALDPNRSPPDEFTVRGREIYLHLMSGVAKTKFTNQYFDSKLSTTSTLRNWRTVQKLLEMLEG